MIKKLRTAFIIFSALVLVFVLFWSIYRTELARTTNYTEATQRSQEVEQALISAYLTDGSFSGQSVSRIVHDWFAANPGMLVLIIHNGTSTAYLYATSQHYLTIDRAADGTIRGVPSLTFHTLQQLPIERSMVFPDNSVRTLTILTTVLARKDVFPIVREILIILLSFLLVTAACLVLFPYLASKASKTAAPPQGQEPGPGQDDQHDESDHGEVPLPSQHQPGTSKDLAADTPESPEENHFDQRGNETQTATAGLYSPQSDLGWEEYLEERLTTELKRAASFDQDLVLILLSISDVSHGSPRYKAFANSVREYFTFRDLCFEFGPSGIGVIVPNIDLDQGIEKCDDFRKAFASTDTMGPSQRLSLGLSARAGRLIQGERLIREAKRALEKAVTEGEEIIAFRVDPEKYRSYISPHR